MMFNILAKLLKTSKFRCRIAPTCLKNKHVMSVWLKPGRLQKVPKGSSMQHSP